MALDVEVIERIEEAAWTVARRSFPADVIRPSVLARTALELSRLYTGPRRDAPPAVASSHLPARLLFFTISELPKWVFSLAQLGRHGSLTAGPAALEVLDLGAGCGAATLGLLAFCAGRRDVHLRVHALDRDPAGMELLGEVLDELEREPGWPRVELATRSQHDAGRPLPEALCAPRYQLVLVGNLLNELPPERASALVRQALTLLAPEGSVVIVEPALREPSRALQRLRDDLLAEDRCRVLFPCVRSGPCPALIDPGDWCHQSRFWTPPPLLRQLSTQSGLRRRELRFSSLCLAAPAKAQAVERAPVTGPGTFRVVSEVLLSKGKRELFLCGAPGRLRAVLLNRHRSPDNEAFRELRRGQLCSIEEATDRGAELRLASESRVVCLDGGIWDEGIGDDGAVEDSPRTGGSLPGADR